MGRLAVLKRFRPNKQQLQVWFLPVLAAILIMASIHTLNDRNSREIFKKHVAEKNLVVGTETIDGFQQVYYEYNNVRIFVTSGGVNHTNPVSSTKYMGWAEQSDVANSLVIYDVLAKTQLRISHGGDSRNPNIYEGKVVWERLRGNQSQIYYFDGLSSGQVSSEFPSVRPVISKTSLAYAQQAPREWRVVQRSLHGATDRVVSRGDETNAWPHFIGDNLRTTYAEYSRFRIGNLGP